jgi:exopolysaccharide production protein ExoY
MQPPVSEHEPHRRPLSIRPRRNSDRVRSLAHMELVRDDEPVLPARTHAQAWADALKRLMDLAGAIALIALLSPVLTLVAIAIKLDSPGPVLFAHRRLGRKGRHFDCLKFRTMQTDAEHRVFEDESLRHHYVSNHFKIPANLDPRITRLGRFLRRSSLDELPQLWNVLKGEMALVGPRPIVALESTHYGDQLDALLSVRPGLTGRWAVGGRSQVGYPARVDLELEYVRNRSIGTDVLILLKTPWAVLTQRGAV